MDDIYAIDFSFKLNLWIESKAKNCLKKSGCHSLRNKTSKWLSLSSLKLDLKIKKSNEE